MPTSKYYRVVQHRSLPKLSTEEAEEQMEARASVREVQRTLLMKQSVENGSTAKATRHLLSGGLRIMDSGSTIRGDDAAASGIHSGMRPCPLRTSHSLLLAIQVMRYGAIETRLCFVPPSHLLTETTYICRCSRNRETSATQGEAKNRLRGCRSG